MTTWDKQKLPHNRYHNDSLDVLTEQVSRDTAVRARLCLQIIDQLITTGDHYGHHEHTMRKI